MSLQERTLVIKNFDPERTTMTLLKELCLQGGPVRNVVIKPDHAFVEYEDVESVGYSKALLEGVELFGRRLSMEPKTRSPNYFKFTHALQDYVRFDKHRRKLEGQQMMAYYQPPTLQPPQPQPLHNSIGYLPFDPSLQQQMPNNFAQGFDPHICEYNNPHASNQFTSPNQFTNPNQMPSTSEAWNNNDNNMRRSHSFNHRRNESDRFNGNKGRWSRRR